MNKLIIGAVFLILFLSSGYSSRAQAGFVGGVKAGLTASEVSGDGLAGPQKPGLYAAVFSRLGVGLFSELQLELMYIQKGSRAIPRESNGFYSYKFNLQYVEIPVSYKYWFSAIDLPVINKLSAEAGLSLSVLVNHYEEDDGRPLDLSDEKPFKGEELNLILGIYYPLNESLDFSLRFNQGLTPLRPHQGGSSVWYNRGQYNTVWCLGLSYSIL